ncbi:MAG: hypothetical protein H7068_04415 [Pedobacter sp.]|nr:hypothetical protein [Chitinophagaceae bacterium]
MKVKILISLFCSVAAIGFLKAQNNTSPYSIIGIGDIEKSNFDRTSGMGHSGLALAPDASNRYLYHGNPASYAGLQDKFFNFEATVRYKGVSYAGSPIGNASSSQSSDLQFKKLVIAIKIKPRWGAAMGLLPYSTSNYSYYSTKNVQGSTVNVATYNEGTGSTNQFFIANSYKINKHLSVGLHTAYIFGQLDQKETLLTNISDSVLVTNRNVLLGSFYFKGGLQFQTKISSKWQLLAGATGSLKTSLKANYQLKVTDGSTALINNEQYKNTYFNLPVMYAGGLAAKFKDKYTFAADYNFQSWTGSNPNAFNYQLVNSSRYSVGFEYSSKINYRDYQGNILAAEKYFLQTGLFYSNSYLRIYGQQLTDYGITFGAGFNSVKSNLGVVMGLEIGRRGTTDLGLIRETYTQLQVTFVYRDFWRVKLKRYN